MRALKTCKNCKHQYLPGSSSYCQPCTLFLRRTGHLPAPHEIKARKDDFTLCTHCGSDYARAKGLCHACYVWSLRHDTPRPARYWLRPKFCTDCKERAAVVKGLCNPCYQWRARHGKRRPRYKDASACSNCGSPNVYAKGQCCACYRYQYIYKKPRPARLWQRWIPDVAQAAATKHACQNCGKPSTHHGTDMHSGRCEACYGYWLKYKKQRERPAYLWQRWAPHGWCECGKPAVTEVTLNVTHGATAYKLCRECYRAEVGHD